MMVEARKARTPALARNRGSAISWVLLGLLSIFEVTFDMLALVAALLGGIARDAGSTSNAQGATSTPGVTSGDPRQLVPQIVADEKPAARPVGITIIAILLCLLGIFEVIYGALALVTSVLPLHSPAVVQLSGSSTC